MVVGIAVGCYEELSAFRLPLGRPKQTKFEWSARQGNQQDSSPPDLIYQMSLGCSRGTHVRDFQWFPHLRASPTPNLAPSLQFRWHAHLTRLFQVGRHNARNKETGEMRFLETLFRPLFELYSLGFLVFITPFAGQNEAFVRCYRLSSLTGAHAQ